MSDFTAAQRDKLMTDLRTVIADAEELLKLSATDATQGAAELNASVRERLKKAQHALGDLQEDALAKARAAGAAADDYVHDHPWRSIGIAAGVGLVVGLLIGRR